MVEQSQEKKVSLEELMVSNLAMTEPAGKLLIEKGVFTYAEFKAKLSAERANYLAVAEAPSLTTMCGRFGASFQYRYKGCLESLW